MKCSFRLATLLVLVFGFRLAVLAQPGTLDMTFNPSDAGFAGSTGFNNWVFSTAVQPDGKILAGGFFSSYFGSPAGKIIRLNPDGSRDGTFNNGGSGANGEVYAILVQPDGKILIGGGFNRYNGVFNGGLMRLNANGTRDNSFATPASPGIYVQTLTQQTDGKILVGGFFDSYNGTPLVSLVRLNDDGSLDPSFTSALTGLDYVYKIVVQPDGKIILAGAFYHDGTSTIRTGIMRLNANGTLDPSFTANSNGTNDVVYALALQADNKILIGGPFSSYQGSPASRLIRLNPDGTRDASFNQNGTGPDNFPNHMLVQPNGQVLLAGVFDTYNGATSKGIVRLHTDGSRDASFNPASTGPSSMLESAIFQSDGKIIINGYFTSFNGVGRNYIARLNGDAGSISLNTIPATTYCAGSTIPLSFTAGGTFNADNIFTAQLSDANGSFANPTAIGTYHGSGSGSIDATIPAAAAGGSGYRIRIISSSPSVLSNDNGANLTVNSVTPDAIPNMSVCAGSTVNAISFSGVAGATAYTWSADNGTAIGMAANSGSGMSLPAFVAENNTTAPITSEIRVTPVMAGGCGARTIVFRIVVKPTPTVATITYMEGCAGGMSLPVAFDGIPGTVYSWTNNNTSIGIGASGTGDLAPFRLVNNTSTVQTAVFTVRPTLGQCVGGDTTFEIRVSPAVVSILYPQGFYCRSGRAYVNLVGSKGGVFTATPGGLSINPATGVVDLAASAPGTYTVTYSVTPAGTFFCGTSASADITIQPTPTVNPVPNQVFCVGVPTAPITFTGSAASSYSWTVSDLSIGLPYSGTGNIGSFVPTATGSAIVRVTPQNDGVNTCLGKPFAFRILVVSCSVAGTGDTGGDAGTLRSSDVSLSPNPASGQVTVRYTGSLQGTRTAMLLNRVGLPVGSPISFSGDRATLNISGLTPGVYTLQLTDIRTGQTVQKQLVKL